MTNFSNLGALYRHIKSSLAAAQIEDAALEARFILTHRLQVNSSYLITYEDTEVEPEMLDLILDDVKRRISGVPLSRIQGARAFWGRDFMLSPATLDPRADTECLIERVLDRCKDNPPETILDLGTGSGCILISLLCAYPKAQGVAVDLSYDALCTARKNAEMNGCADRIRFICGSWDDALSAHFDLVVSNPPYIESGIIPTLSPDVKNHDPILALDGGKDGLDAYRKILKNLKNILNQDSTAFFEIGFDQGESVMRLARESGFSSIYLSRDLAGLARVVEISNGDK